MSNGVQVSERQMRQSLDADSLTEWIPRQRWYASKSRNVTGIEVVETSTVSEQPLLALALVQTRFATGTHELYQLPLTLHAAGETTADEDAIARSEQWGVHDALAEPDLLVELLRGMDQEIEIDASEGHFSFRRSDGVLASGAFDGATARVLAAEQSNSSIVFDERLVLKVFRKLEPGMNPELEVLHFLGRRGFTNIAPLHGWYEYDGYALATTLGIVQSYLPDATDGWELALDEITPGGAGADSLLDRLGSLGAVTARMHNVLASDASDPAFSPEEPSSEALSLLTATIDEDIEQIFARLPDDERLKPIAGRGQDVRERLAARAQAGTGGRVIRTHGDYHLGQTLYTPRGWVLVDFEGEPARALTARRQKRSPLRDVAGMLRSFAYVTSAVEIIRDAHAPEDFEQRARERFLDQYLTNIDSSLLPAGNAHIENLLSIFELEKAIYELRYELDNRPDWISIPVAGITRLLEAE